MKQLRRSEMVFLLLMPLLTLAPAASGRIGDASTPSFRGSRGPRAYGASASIEGYVQNDSHYWVSNVRLRIEGFDAERRPVGAATYRITVISFDVVSRGP